MNVTDQAVSFENISNLRVPLQRLFHLPGGEFNGIFLADPSGHYRAVLNLISVDAFVLHEPFYGPGQCFRVFLNDLD